MPEQTREQKADHVRRRVRAAQDPDRYHYNPGKEKREYADIDEELRVVIYARVSTLNPSQTSSFELQQKYYEDLVRKYPKWTLIKIYADEGKSGVTIQNRDGFNEMMEDAKNRKFDLIIVKSISRLARNVMVLLSTVKRLAVMGIGVLFESENVYSLNDKNSLLLTFQATVAEEESRIRSRSMESSIRMRLDHGLPLTPELLGFQKDEDGKLRINPKTMNIPKLMFSMYLFGYSTEQIANTLTKLSKRTYLGNLKWTPAGVADTLRNERYCGDVETRKRFRVFAADVVTQKTFKNRGEKPQSYYIDEHDAIISRDDYLAVQRIMNNAKYGGNSLLPELKVIPKGLLKGFVIVHPRWGSFTEDDYMTACRSVEEEEPDITIKIEPGSFDMRNFQHVSMSLFDENKIPSITLEKDKIRFSKKCISEMNCGSFIELLIHPIQKKIAIRPTTKENRCAIQWVGENKSAPRMIACKAYIETLFRIFEWDSNLKIKMYGDIYKDGKDAACIFTTTDISIYARKEHINNLEPGAKFLAQSGNHVQLFSGNPIERMGQSYYVEKTMREMVLQTKDEWQTMIEGRLCSTGEKLNITPYEELKSFIKQELGDLFEEVQPG